MVDRGQQGGEERGGRKERTGYQRAPRLLQEQAQIDQRTSRDPHPGPKVAPERVGHVRVAHVGAHQAGRALAGHELAGGATQQLLVLCDREVHRWWVARAAANLTSPSL